MRFRQTSSVHSVERALAILELLDRSQRCWSISDISRRLGIPKSTAHTVVLTLERLGYVTQEQDSRAYRLGLKSCCLGQGTTSGLALGKEALAVLERAAQSTDLEVHLAVLEGDQAVCIHLVESPSGVSFDTYVGKRTNLHCTAIGKVLLAYSKADFQRRFLSKRCLGRYTQHTVTSMECLREELRNVRERRYAVADQEEELGTRGLAVPVVNVTGALTAALGVTATLRQLPPSAYDRVAVALHDAASRLGRPEPLPNGPVSPEDSAKLAGQRGRGSGGLNCCLSESLGPWRDV